MNKSKGKGAAVAAARGGGTGGRTAIQIAVAFVLIALVAGIGIGIAVNHKTKNSVAGGTATPTVNAMPPAAGGVTGSITDTGSIRIGKPGAPVSVRVVADLQCPVCKMFEAANSATLTDEVNNGTATVDYDILAFLDRASSGTRYSSRASNAAYCVATADPTKFQGWLSAMFEAQPPENGKGLDNDKIIQISQTAGVTDPGLADCVNSEKYGQFVTKTTQQVLASGINATPTIFINGKAVPNQQNILFGQDGLKPLIEAAKP
ncbi:DsbA family protein [Nocardia stercoris]|uniref:Disulfide bond formation protein DsbA n=1 Tax=Nocardia stercoris TaxID=2483361 RepID=A0A3M2L4M1_9NOCA|nr:thioredoxin domain-containing protein [Nocardia stercoris]RMI30825.1 disulfide bond formation protein DsbA [Nocardia stercoris]